MGPKRAPRKRKAEDGDEENESHLEKRRRQQQVRRYKECPAKKEKRLECRRVKYRESRDNESASDREARLAGEKRNRLSKQMSETEEHRSNRLDYQRNYARLSQKDETPQEKECRLSYQRDYVGQLRSEERPQEKESRLTYQKEYAEGSRIRETLQQQDLRLEYQRQYAGHARASETQEQHNARLEYLRQYARTARSVDIEKFRKTVYTFCDKVCQVCTKKCYPHQIYAATPSSAAIAYLPAEIKDWTKLEVCSRCKTHLTSIKKFPPSQAYWNNLDPGPIPPEILALTESEQRMLSRITPFLKVVKLDGRFGQFGIRGQAVLFAQDILEVTNQLPSMLPRSANDSGLVIVTEHLEDIDVVRSYSVSPERISAALKWLVKNNPLYKDVTINETVVPDVNVRVANCENTEQDVIVDGSIQHDVTNVSAYLSLTERSRILRASMHQGTEVFDSEVSGKQCCAMAVANIIRAAIIAPKEWLSSTLDDNLLAGNTLYCNVLELIESVGGHDIGPDGYLEVRHLDATKDHILMFGKQFRLEYNSDPEFFGSLLDNINLDFGWTLQGALQELFSTYSAGVLICNRKSFGLLYHDGKYYFTDAHSCDKNGKTTGSRGKACVIECDTLDELLRVCRNKTGFRNVEYTISYVAVVQTNTTENHGPMESDSADCVPRDFAAEYGRLMTSASNCQGTNNEDSRLAENSLSHCAVDVPIQTSIMLPIDCDQPDENDEFEVHENVYNIRRKTKDNIVNTTHERKSEEYGWFFLFPYGKNGLMEDRAVKISMLNYAHLRALGSDPRFQKNDFLFYMLSTFESHRIQQTISACGKKIEGPDGQIQDVHLIMRNLRGSAAYWKTALVDLLAQIRSLGPTTYFLTFSCNDLHWLDMRKALLLADGRPNEDPSALGTYDVQLLIEKYPVVVSRHFMVRVGALMKFLHQSPNLLGGAVEDHWWRIEFQKRGSPHLHMLVWVKDHPDFNTEEGLVMLDSVISCRMPDAQDSLHNIVKKCQLHQHTATCKKHDSTVECRFAFPRRPCEATKIVALSSEDFLRSGGRICILKRRPEDKWVNNYNPILLQLWEGNMDIQPCGSNESIAIYLTKYVAKPEPTSLCPGLSQALKQIEKEETNVSRMLWRKCMRITKDRQVSACESVFRLCHLPLRDSSRKCVFLNTRKPDQRYKVIKFDTMGNATGFCANIFERYENRPEDQPEGYRFENMSLLEFAALFDPYYGKYQDEEELVDVAPEETSVPVRQRLLTLRNNMKMRIRSVPAVVRVPYFKASADPENYYYSLLLQYVPYRNEADLLGEHTSAKNAFLAREEQLRAANASMEVYRRRDQQLENAFTLVHAMDYLNEDPVEDVEVEYEEIPEEQINLEHFQQACSSMNAGQHKIMSNFKKCIEEQLAGSSTRLRLFITGNAGTGKTFLFKLLRSQANVLFEETVVKTCALTGVAAKLVGGSTLHSALKLPVQKDGRSVNMSMLTGNYLRLMRLQWAKIQFLFIDEISMVPYEMLCMIDSRLRQLKNNDDVFGGINVLVFGDLLQLPPVRGSPVFEQPERLQPATHLWRLFSLIELTQNMRQQGNADFVNLLNSLRIGELSSEGMKVLMSKLLKEEIEDFAPHEALRIFPTNQQVTDHNKKVIDYYRSQNTRIFKVSPRPTNKYKQKPG